MKATIQDLKMFLDQLPVDKINRIKHLSSDQKTALGLACINIDDDKLIMQKTKLKKYQIKQYSEFAKRSESNKTIYDYLNKATKRQSDVVDDTTDVANNIMTKQHEVRYSKLHVNIETELYKEFRKICIDNEVTVTELTGKLINEYVRSCNV